MTTDSTKEFIYRAWEQRGTIWKERCLRAEAALAARSSYIPDAEAMAIVREIAAKDENDWLPDGILVAVGGPVYSVSVCCFCEAELRGHDATVEAHEPDCLFVRARAIVARLDGKESE